jgi:hypothetical protein
MLQATLPTNNIIGQELIAKESVARENVIKRFTSWINSQEENRFLWLGVALMAGIGAILPLTLLAIVFFANNSFTLWVITLAINVPVLITNLSAQPVKVTLPILLSSWVINAAIIAYSVMVYFAV